MPLLVVNNAVIGCTLGTAPANLVSTVSATITFTSGCAQSATIFDHLPGVHIKPFGQCKKEGKPCEPVTPALWSVNPVSTNIFSPAMSLLTEGCTLPCTKGGTVEILFAGQSEIDASDIYVPPSKKGKSLLGKIGDGLVFVVKEAAPVAFSYVPVVGQAADIYNLTKAIASGDERAIADALLNAAAKKIPLPKSLKKKGVDMILKSKPGKKATDAKKRLQDGLEKQRQARAKAKADAKVGPPPKTKKGIKSHEKQRRKEMHDQYVRDQQKIEAAKRYVDGKKGDKVDGLKDGLKDEKLYDPLFGDNDSEEEENKDNGLIADAFGTAGFDT